MRIYIKNMVCDRCISAVRQQLDAAGISVCHIKLGEVETKNEPDTNQLDQLRVHLSSIGFELLDDNKKQLIEKIKNVIITHVHHNEKAATENFSDVISAALHRDYSNLSKLFSEVEGITIEKFIINHKVEKIKELIIYDELSLSEIAFRLNYSSVAHMSSQFKKSTGLTPGHFRKMGLERKPLDSI